MRKKSKAKQVSINDTILFTIEILDESPDGFSACVPELGIYTFGATEEQAMRRVHKHVTEKYQDLVSCPTQLNENEQEYLQHYRAITVPADSPMSLPYVP